MNDSDLTPVCLICEVPAKNVFRAIGKFKYYRCSTCTGIFVHPVKEQSFYLSTETYLTNAETHLQNDVDLRGTRWMIEQFERLYISKTQLESKGSFLEIGAGTGFLTLFALARGWNAKAIETSKSAVEFASKMLKIDILESTIETYKTTKKFDAILMVEVLEHFRDPMNAIKLITKLTTGHTILFGTTPNTDSQHWINSKQNIYVPEGHIFLFNEKSLKIFADKSGIKDLTIEYFGSGKLHDSNLIYCGVISNYSSVSKKRFFGWF